MEYDNFSYNRILRYEYISETVVKVARYISSVSVAKDKVVTIGVISLSDTNYMLIVRHLIRWRVLD